MIQASVKVKTKKETKNPVTNKHWFIVNAKNKVLGRLATRIAIILMGKHKPTWQPYLDDGDNIIVINAAKVKLTGKKEKQKEYFRYSGYPGGLKVEVLEKLRVRKPEYIIEHAVKGMLPKNRLGAVMIKNLHVYAGDNHPHVAQKPQELEV